MKHDIFYLFFFKCHQLFSLKIVYISTNCSYINLFVSSISQTKLLFERIISSKCWFDNGTEFEKNLKVWEKNSEVSYIVHIV